MRLFAIRKESSDLLIISAEDAITAFGNWLYQGVQQRRQERVRQTTKVAMGVLTRQEEGHTAIKDIAQMSQPRDLWPT